MRGDGNGGKPGGGTVALAISEEQQRAITTGREQLLVAAQVLVIDSPEAEQAGWEIVNGIANLRGVIEGDFAPSKKGAHAAWKAVVAQERGHLGGLVEPDQIVRAKLAAWKREQERVRREAARKEEERVEAEAAEARRVAEDKQVTAAVEAEDAGDREGADAILDAPLVVEPVAPVVPPPPPAKVPGAGAMVRVWLFEVVDAKVVPREFLAVDMGAIKRAVQLHKEDAEIPGVRVYSELRPRRRG